MSREGGQAKRNPGLARARGLLRPALFVTASEFYGVPFGRNSHASTRQGTQVVEASVIRHCLCVSRGSVWPRVCRAFSLKLVARYGVAFSVLQAAKRNGGGVFVAFVVARSIGRATTIPFGRKSHASTRQGAQATVRASSVSRGQAGQTESGTRKGTQVVEACVVRHCQRVSRGSVWPRTCWPFSLRRGARYGLAFSVLQAAKRNGGGDFVAFIVVGGRAVIIWRPYSGRQCRKSRSHSVWRAGEMVAR